MFKRLVPAQVRARLRKLKWLLLGERMGLQPLDQLEHRLEGSWRATGYDPKFACVASCYPLKAGWYRLTVDLEMLEGVRLQPMLYFDFGHGMHEAWSVGLNFIRQGMVHHDGVVLLPYDVRTMRFDPMDAPGVFRINGLVLRPLSRPQAAWRMLRALFKRRDESLAPGVGALISGSLQRLSRRDGRHVFATWLYALYIGLKDAKPSYEAWLDLYDKTAVLPALESDVLVSILLPTYNTPDPWLRKCLDSVLAQTYQNWELCIADDASTHLHVKKTLKAYAARDSRIRIIWRDTNGHISAATNSALAVARGSYVAFLDHDDELHPHALATIIGALKENPQWQLVYSDEDKIDTEGNRYDPYFKSDWNPDLFYGQNCVCHLGVYARSLLESVGGLREGMEGSQDWDLALRCSERLRVNQIGHIPRILYHWRAIPGSTALGAGQKGYAHEAGLCALREHFQRIGTNAEVLEIDGMIGAFRVRHPLPAEQPLVSIVVPTRDNVGLLRRCISSILEHTTYSSYEILVVDNQSVEPATLDYFDSLAANPRIRVLKHDKPFNYSRINNEAVAQCHGQLICLLNNDVEVITPGWLEEMASHAWRPKVGAVGAMLYYPNNTIQHAGVIIGVHGVAAHPYCRMPRGYEGQMNRARLAQAMSAVTAACLVVRKDVYEESGGLDHGLQVAFNDIDFCLRLRQLGYINIWTPFAELYHHESATRGYENTPEKRERFEREIDFMVKRWSKQLQEDPYYNPNLSLSSEAFSLAFPPREWLTAGRKSYRESLMAMAAPQANWVSQQ